MDIKTKEDQINDNRKVGFEQQNSDHIDTSTWNIYKLAYQECTGVTWQPQKGIMGVFSNV